MPALLRDLIAQRDFGVVPLTPAEDTRVAVRWAHSTDLDDPTPFIEPGQMVLTTGRQFPGPDDPADYSYAGYVTRLRDAGVVAVGFGTEVIREGTPHGLVTACLAHGLPLVEVPYRTPFIAITRWIADVYAAEARAHMDQTLSSQRAVSLAALGNGGLPAAARAAGTALRCAITLYDPDGEPTFGTDGTGSGRPSASDGPGAEVDAQVREMLRAGRRSRRVLADEGGHTVLETLGGQDDLYGALVVQRPEPLDDLDMSVVVTLVALAEVSLEHHRTTRLSLRALMGQLFQLLRDGQLPAVRKALEAVPAGLPGRTLRVVALGLDGIPPSLRDALERRAWVPDNRLFVVEHRRLLVLLVDARTWPPLRRLLTSRAGTAGISEPVEWNRLNTAIVQAERALDAARPGETRSFGQLVSDSFLGLLSAPQVVEVAAARLDGLLATADGQELLRQARVWLRHNGQWHPAAQELGIHRHSLKGRIATLESALGLSLDRFAGRAELWALLTAVEQEAR